MTVARLRTSSGWIDLAGIPPPAASYATTIGDGSTTVFTITHNLNTVDAVVEVREAAGNLSYVYPEIRKLTDNSLSLIFDVAPSTNQYRVLVTGGTYVGIPAGSVGATEIADGSITSAEIAAWGVYGRNIQTYINPTPPPSPSLGDFWVLNTGGGFWWLFIYDTTEATYKWKFCGGGAMYSQNIGAQAWAGSANTWQFLAGNPSLTVPRAGDYECDWNMRLVEGTTAGVMSANAGIDLNSSGSPVSWSGASTPGNSSQANISGSVVIAGVAASALLRLLTFQNSAAINNTYDMRLLKVRPIRVI